MTKIDIIINGVINELDNMEFHEILYEARERLGLRLYKVAEHTGIPMARLKRLESGVFRTMPLPKEFVGLSEFYGIPEEDLRYKASSYLEQFARPKKSQEFLNG